MIREIPTSSHFPVVVLLPARNAEADLEGFFASIAGICDAVVALDDGSTDGTLAALERSPLVKVLLRNPRREDYRGWDDAANRNRLLEAAADLNPEWILSLDADERFDRADAESLKTFLATDALPGCAYGFRHVPMRRDEETFWPKYQWIYRLFSYESGQRFPDQRLHFTPVPTSIPQQLWFKTTLRVQHLGGMTDARRLLRFSKYLEADPTRRYQTTYRNVLNGPPPHDLRRWQRRPSSLPVLLSEATSPDVRPDALPGHHSPPVLSAIIISRNDEATIRRSVAAVVNQLCPEPFEVIVVTSGRDRTAEIIRLEFPSVKVVALDHPALPGEARNAGLAVAEGLFVSFPGSHVELPPGSLAARLSAHRRGYAMVTGVASNGNTTKAGWAAFFLDHQYGLPGHSFAELNGPPAHCSYACLPLMEVGGFPENVRTAEDTAVNRALVRRGYVAVRDPSIQIIYRSPSKSLFHLVRHHFTRGRGWGRLLLEDYRDCGQLLNKQTIREQFLNHLPAQLETIRRNVQLADPSLRLEYEGVRSFLQIAAISSLAGMWWEILKPGRGKMALLLDHPLRSVLFIGEGRETLFVLSRVDLLSGRASTQRLPADLPVPTKSNQMSTLSTLVSGAGKRNQTSNVNEAIAQSINIADLDIVIGPRSIIERAISPRSSTSRYTLAEDSPFTLLTNMISDLRWVAAGALRTTMPIWMLGAVLRSLQPNRTEET